MMPYDPIDCDLYDELTVLVMRQQHCNIQYRNEQNHIVTIEDQLIDVYTQDKQEFVRLKSGSVIRLDALITINQLRFKDR